MQTIISAFDWLYEIDPDRDFAAIVKMNEMLAHVRSVIAPATLIIYMPVERLSETINRPTYEVITIVSCFITFLVCLPMPWFRDPTFRKTYSLFWGILLSFYTYGVSFLLNNAFVMIAYF